MNQSAAKGLSTISIAQLQAMYLCQLDEPDFDVVNDI